MRQIRTAEGFRRIDEKHHLAIGADREPIIVKTTNGQSIPSDEPIILFRGRDKLAVKMLKYYRDLCVDDGCTPFQLESMNKMIGEFQDFADTSSTMKQPGSTSGA